MTVFSLSHEKMLSIAQFVLNGEITVEGSACGAHKKVLLCHDGAHRYAIHFVEHAEKDLVVSGILIRQRLVNAGLRFPRHLRFDEVSFPFLVIVEERISGRDLEHCLDGLPVHAAIEIAQTVADTVKASACVFHPSSNRVGHHLVDKDPTTKDMKTFFQDGLAIAKQGFLAKRDTEWLPALHNLSASAQEMGFYAPSQTFIWDVLERNIMVESHSVSGFVDQDSLLTGDIFQVPAWASVYLDMKGFAFTKEYVETWMERWDAEAEHWDRFRMYRASYGLFQQARSGQMEASGRIKQGVCRKKLWSWLEEALRTK